MSGSKYAAAMADTPGLRERKKLRTRATLVQAAMRLFAEQGYDRTTVAEIAAAADVSTRTFFSYFTGKEAVVFGDSERHMRVLMAVLAERAPADPMVEVLLAAIDTVIEEIGGGEPDHTFVLAPITLRLVHEVPALRAAALQRAGDRQREVTSALLDAYPGADPVDVAAMVGALVGAINSAALASLARGDGPAEMLAAMRRGAEVVALGLRAVVAQP